MSHYTRTTPGRQAGFAKVATKSATVANEQEAATEAANRRKRRSVSNFGSASSAASTDRAASAAAAGDASSDASASGTDADQNDANAAPDDYGAEPAADRGQDDGIDSATAAAGGPDDDGSSGDSTSNDENAERHRERRKSRKAARRALRVRRLGGADAAMVMLAKALQQSARQAKQAHAAAMLAQVAQAATQTALLAQLASNAARAQRRFVKPTLLARPLSVKAFTEWVADLLTLFEQHEAATFREQLIITRDHWERDLEKWFVQESDVRDHASRAPVASWEELTGMLEAQFLPQADTQAAVTELLAMRQAAGEAMMDFTFRFKGLRMRVPDKLFNNDAYTQIVLAAVHQSCAKAQAAVRRSLKKWQDGHGGDAFDLLTLSAELCLADREAKAEAAVSNAANQHAARAAAAAAAANHRAGGDKKAAKHQAHIAQLMLEQTEVNEEYVLAMALHQTAKEAGKLPVGSRAPGHQQGDRNRTYQHKDGRWHYSDAQSAIIRAANRCLRCGGKNHQARGCTLLNKDLSNMKAADFQ